MSIFFVGLFGFLSFFDIYSIIAGVFPVILSAIFLFKTLLSNSKKLNQSIFLSGNLWFLFGFVTIFIITPIYLSLSTNELAAPFRSINWREHFWQAEMLAATAIQSVTTGQLLSSFAKKRGEESTANSHHSSPIISRVVAFPSIVAIVIAILIYGIWLHSTGDPLTSLFGTRRARMLDNLSARRGYLASSYLIIVGILSYWILRFRLQRDRKKVYLLTISFLILMLPSITSGDRSIFIYFIVVLICIFLSTGGKVKWKMLAVVMLLLPIIISAPRAYRDSPNLSEINSFERYYSSSTISDFLTAGDTAMAPTFSILLLNMNQKVDHMYGQSYFQALMKPIPRAIYPSKPMEFDNKLMLAIFPAYASFVGFSFSGLSEPYVNFGLIGVIVFFTLLGYISDFYLRRTSALVEKSILINAWVAPFMFILSRGNLTTDIHRLLFPLLSTLIVLRFSRNRIL